MAKLVVNSESLVSVADAIRSKGNTAEHLQFPQGFVDGINAIESGGQGEEFIGIKYSDFGGAYNLPQVADARSFENIAVNKYPEFVYNSLFYNNNANANGGFHSNLQEVYLPDIKPTGLTNTFINCGALTTIHGNLETVETVNSAFSYCKVLPYAPYMPNLKRLGGNAFSYCETFTEFKFYSKASSIHTSAFTGCTNLTDIYVPWAEGEVSGAPWNATSATIHYNTTYDENHEPIIAEV